MRKIKLKAKMSLSILITSILFATLANSITSWKDDPFLAPNNFDISPDKSSTTNDLLTLLDDYRKLCDNDEDYNYNYKECQYLMSENMKDYTVKRKTIEASSLPLIFLKNKVSASDGAFGGGNGNNNENNKSYADNNCSCVMKHGVADLGHNYFPRYVSTGVCKKDSCRKKHLKCVPRTYKVNVLRRKSAVSSDNDPEADVTSRNTLLKVPEALKNAWSIDTVIVNVACQCTH